MIFGILGYGRFGKLWAASLSPFGKVWVYDSNPSLKNKNSIVKNVTLQQLGNVDILFLTVPIHQLASACKQIKKFLMPHTVIVDCCSVKIYPSQVIKKILGNQPVFLTHPLFGPDSVKNNGGLTGLKIVVCPTKKTQAKKQKVLLAIFKKMGLLIIKATPSQHDKQMAHSQALVHFIGRGLSSLKLQPQKIATPDFQALLNMNQMVNNDTWQLFIDMQHFNPYAEKIRKKLMERLYKIETIIKLSRPHMNK